MMMGVHKCIYLGFVFPFFLLSFITSFDDQPLLTTRLNHAIFNCPEPFILFAKLDNFCFLTVTAAYSRLYAPSTTATQRSLASEILHLQDTAAMNEGMQYMHYASMDKTVHQLKPQSIHGYCINVPSSFSPNSLQNFYHFAWKSLNQICQTNSKFHHQLSSCRRPLLLAS